MSDRSKSSTTSALPPQKKRIRAVVACSHCRSKRSKCDGIPGQQACTQCQQRGIECEMSDGKRNRGHYKPQAEALAKRVRLLEEALAEARTANQELLARQQQQHYSHQHHHMQHRNLPDNPFVPWERMDMDDASAAPQPPSSVFAMPEIDVDAHSGMILPPATTAPTTTTIAESLAASSSMPPPSHSFSAQHSRHASHYLPDHDNIMLSSGGSVNNGHGHTISISRSSLERSASGGGGAGGGRAATAASASASATAASASASFPAHRPCAACCADLGLTPPLVDYLLGLFFHRYQMMMKFVSQQDFMTLHEAGNSGDGDGSEEQMAADAHAHSYCRKHRSGSGSHALFLAMLAAGLRYSTRPDVTDRFLLRPDGENKLATAARRAVETEVGHPTLATVQTVLILCEVETSLDHQMTGYMYSCLASKLIFEMGLDLGSATSASGSSNALTAEETAIRHWLVWAASVHDQFWAVFLRRPLAIKNRTLQLSRLAWRFAEGGGRVGNSEESNGRDMHGDRPPPSFEDEVNDNLMDLMELARELTDELYGAASSSPLQQQQQRQPNNVAQAVAAAVAAEAAAAAVEEEDNGTSASSPPYDGGGLPHAYHEHAAQRQAHNRAHNSQLFLPDVASLDVRLDKWFASLSDRVRRGPVSGHDCYQFMFVLHLHFNATKIILHRTRAFPAQDYRSQHQQVPYTPSGYPLPSPVTPSPGSGSGGGGHHSSGSGGDYAAAASMATLGHASICIAKLFETFRRREDIRTLQCTGVQWAAMASEALTWYIETLPIDGAIEAVAHLQSLSRTLKDMTRTFLPAVYPYDRTNHALRMFLRRMDGGGADSPPLPQVPPEPVPGGVAKPQQQTQQQQKQQQHIQQTHQAQQQIRDFDTNMATQVFTSNNQHTTHPHQGMYHHPSFHGLNETASSTTAPSAPDLATTTATSFSTMSATRPPPTTAPPASSLFEAGAASVAATADGSVSVVSLSAASKDLNHHHQQHNHRHQQSQHPGEAAAIPPGPWAEQDPWDWDDLLER